MKLHTIAHRIFYLLSFNCIKLTPEGVSLNGPIPLTTEEFSKNFLNWKLEILRELESLNPPLSTNLKENLLSEINSRQVELLEKQEAITSWNNPILDLMLAQKLSFCKEVTLHLNKLVPSSSNQKSMQEKIPMKLSLREISIWLYGHRATSIFDIDQANLMEFFSENFLYFNERERKYCEINLNTLKKEYSVVKGNFGSRFVDDNPIASTEEKINLVLTEIRSRYNENAKQ